MISALDGDGLELTLSDDRRKVQASILLVEPIARCEGRDSGPLDADDTFEFDEAFEPRDILGAKEGPSEIQRAALEFERFAQSFHAFATGCLPG